MMGRAVLVLNSPAIRAKAAQWISAAREGSRITFQGPQRSIPQNSKLWACLTDIATQCEHFGRKYEPESWKCIFLHALGRGAKFVPALDGQSVVPIGQRSSDLSVEEMSELIELIHAYGAEKGVIFHEPLTPAELRNGKAA